MPIKKEPLYKKCFECFETLLIKFVPPHKEYSQKNNWGYWTEKDENKDNYICRSCLRRMYYKDRARFLESVQSEKKKRLLRTYLSSENQRGVKIL